MVDPVTCAPDGSVTVPDTDPSVVWASAAEHSIAIPSTAQTGTTQTGRWLPMGPPSNLIWKGTLFGKFTFVFRACQSERCKKTGESHRWTRVPLQRGPARLRPHNHILRLHARIHDD